MAEQTPPPPIPLDIGSPLGTPNWRQVTQVAVLPFIAVGHVTTLERGVAHAFGTCWRIGNQTAVTAAHVVEKWGPATVAVLIDFSDEPNCTVLEVLIDQRYEAKQPFDPWDLALLRLPSRRREHLKWDSAGSIATKVVGFPFGDKSMMVESEGSARRAPDPNAVLHTADTSQGHSGGPLLMPVANGSTIVNGIHIGGFNSNPHGEFPRHNVALTLRPDLEQLMLQQLARWG
jgi:V8-like Glu-specific endopeptidase